MKMTMMLVIAMMIVKVVMMMREWADSRKWETDH